MDSWMSDHAIAVVGIVFGMPALVVALAIGYAMVHRYLRHKERLALIEKGIVPDELKPGTANSMPGAGFTSGLILAAVGLALTVGLATIGIGPWLIAGLIPLAVGGALVVAARQGVRDNRGEESDEG
ncbi:MAG: hypothetical protein H0Z37_01240 [Firmicutes bacterium]|nr:hypothetical protein [Bacillota bacterium]